MADLIDILSSYVPNIVAQRFSKETEPLTEPLNLRFPAAVFFADISGFTKIAENLADQGISGAEELTRLLNNYFGEMISIIAAHGGDVVKFAGDALFAMWYNPDGDLHDATLRAVQCARSLIENLNNYQVESGIRLSIRVSIGAGEVLAISAGGVLKRWEFLIAGKPLQQVGRASEAASAGDVMLSPEAYAQVIKSVSGRPGEERHYLVETVTEPLRQRSLPQINLSLESQTALRGFVPGAILNRMQVVGEAGWLAEHRRVSVIFLQVANLDFSSPEAVDQLQSIMQTMQITLYHYEGSVRQLIEDDKGTVFIAALGLPPFTHQDDPLRAVQASLNMHTKLEKMGFQTRIGITTGNVFCGPVGNKLRREYAMVGNTVNLAARLMGAAKRHQVDILCDEATYQASNMHIGFKVLPPIRLKNIAEPVTMYTPSGEIQVANILRPLVGRQRERNTLTTYLRKLRNRESNVIVIEGRAGLGKTRLVEDLLEQAQALDILYIVGTATSVEKTTPYHIWNDIFSKLFDVGLNSRTTMRRTSIMAKLLKNKEIIQQLPLLNSVLHLDMPETTSTANLDDSVKLRSMRKLMLQLLQVAIENEPVLLVLENAQWIDAASWEFANTVTQSVQPLLMVIVRRPTDSLNSDVNLLINETVSDTLSLQPLTVDETASLIRQCLGVAEVDSVIEDIIYTQAQGNPFFSEELAYALRDAGSIRLVDGAYHLQDNNMGQFHMAVPETLQGVITSRIDRLSAEVQLTLKVASVIGEQFTFRLLYDIYPIDAYKPQLQEHLDSLQELDLIEARRDKSETTYFFKQSLTHEVTYNLIPFTQRRELHETLARWYQRNFVYDLSPYYSVLAHHWEHAGEKVQAVKYLEKAGEQSLQSGAYQQAIDILKHALQIGIMEQTLGSTYRIAHWERLIGEAYWAMHMLSEARQHAQKALTWLHYPTPEKIDIWSKLLLQEGFTQALHRLFPARYIGEFADNIPFASEATYAYRLLSEVAFIQGDMKSALYGTLAALNTGEQVNERHPQLARIYANMYIAATTTQRPAIARVYKRLALSTVEKINKPAVTAPALTRLGLYDIVKGQWTSARGFIEQAAQISEQLGDRRGCNDTQILLGFLQYFQGEFWSGADSFDAVALRSQRIGNADHRIIGLAGYALHLLALDKTRLAMVQTEQAKPIWSKPSTDISTRLFGKAVHALVTVRTGHLGRAKVAAEDALQDLEAAQHPLWLPSLYGMLALTEVYLTLWENGDKDTVGIFRRLKLSAKRYSRTFVSAKPFLGLARGHIAWVEGHKSQARKLWQAAARNAQVRSVPYAEGMAYYELALHTKSEAQKQSYIQSARQILEPLEASYYLDRLKEISS